MWPDVGSYSQKDYSQIKEKAQFNPQTNGQLKDRINNEFYSDAAYFSSSLDMAKSEMLQKG